MATMLLLIAIATAVLLLLLLHRVVVFLFNLRRMRILTANFPGPVCYPIIGNFLEVSGPPEDVYDKLLRVASTYGPTLRLWIGHVLFVAVMNPDDIETILTNQKLVDKSMVYSAMEPLMGNGLAILGGERWRRHRKAITPSLHLEILQDFVDVFYRKGLAFAKDLERLADAGTVFDVTPMCGICSNNAVCETVMSTDVAEDDSAKKDFVDSVPRALDHFMYRVWHPWFLNDWLYSWTSYFPEYLEIKQKLDNFTHQIIKTKRSQLSAVDQPRKRRQAFLDHILSSKEGSVLNDRELAEEVKTIVSIASGSSMDALSFLLYTLAIRPDIQDKVVQELNDVLGEDIDRPIVHTDLGHFEYLERVIKETFRYFSVVPIFARSCPEDIKLPSGYIIPRGAQIAFWLPYVHMNSQYFPEPKIFDPDRFLPEIARQRHPFSYIPFSAGPRNCIGQRYAMMFLKTITISVLRRIRVVIPEGGPTKLEDVPLQMNLTLSVRNGANIRTERRRRPSQ